MELSFDEPCVDVTMYSFNSLNESFPNLAETKTRTKFHEDNISLHDRATQLTCVSQHRY